jgi:hypothetical protein
MPGHQALASPRLHSQAGQITSGSPLCQGLDQDHLHPKLEVPRLTCPRRKLNLASAVEGKHSRKDPFKQLFNSYSEHQHMSKKACDNIFVSLSVPDPDPPDPHVLGPPGSGYFYHQAEIVRKTLILTVL